MARMTQPWIKSLLVLAIAVLAATLAIGCGNDVPPNAVAKVGDETISQDEFDRWVETAVKGQAQGGAAVVPDPPDFTKCVAAKKKAPVAQGQAKQSDAQLEKQCKTEFDTLKREVMQFLIQAEWVQQEADKRDIKVSDKAVQKSFNDQKKQAFPTDKAYKQFLKTSGMTEEDILFRVKLDQLQQKLTQKVTQDAKKVSDADIQEYYDKNEKRFEQPERRDLRVVLTKTEDKANEARQALESGQSWKDVAKEFSIDEASKAQAGKLAAVAKGQQDKALEDAVFAAKKGELQGPVKTQFGWYVFEVEKITEASQQSLEQSKDTIRNLLRSERQQKALDGFIKDFREEYKDQTNCSDDYRVAECKNAPKEKTETAPAAGGGQAPQPEPQAPTPEK
ncbi:MAG: foldase protein PrsA [Thermoleophilaceae bacterium]|jgi:foldase protein PrsA|nr:foldase protein PrsA [Thermoleophilaceae bacterium]